MTGNAVKRNHALLNYTPRYMTAFLYVVGNLASCCGTNTSEHNHPLVGLKNPSPLWRI